jgi:phage terminase small subunit
MSQRTVKTERREELFVAGILAHGNATQAAKDCGYSAKTAHAKGNELLKRPSVKAALDAARSRIVRKFKVSAERVVEEMALIGFSDLRNYVVDDNGLLGLAPNAPDTAMRAVKKYKRKIRWIPQRGEDLAPIKEVEVEFELWSKDTELRNLGDYLKLFKENRADGDEAPEDRLTPAQREERITALLRKAVAKKRQSAGARK